MLNDKQLANYAELVVKVGVNLQKGQDLLISSPIECGEIARQLAVEAYKAGARDITINYTDEKMTRIRLDHGAVDVLTNIPKWLVAMRDTAVDNRACTISISAGDPSIYSGVDADKLSKYNNSLRLAIKKFREATMSNLIRWCVISVPTVNWAKKVFPDCDATQAVDKLWASIGKAMRLDAADPVAEWKKHIDTLHRRSELLNSYNFDHLLMTSRNGTNLKVGLAKDHLWLAAREMGQDNVPFTANMPTEEIFTAPHKYKVDGVLKSALPLVENGNVIDKFSITFKDGRVTDFSAEKGYDTLKHLINTDEGSHHLGEVALIGKKSPIAQMGILFFNTLFDENASCHLAIGKAYPTTVKNGNNMTLEQLDKMGVNDSLEHCDFMIGSSDFNVVGVTAKGEKVQLFVDGDWVV